MQVADPPSQINAVECDYFLNVNIVTGEHDKGFCEIYDQTTN